MSARIQTALRGTPILMGLVGLFLGLFLVAACTTDDGERDTTAGDTPPGGDGSEVLGDSGMDSAPSLDSEAGESAFHPIDPNAVQPPTLSIDAPASGLVVALGTPVTLTVTAADPDTALEALLLSVRATPGPAALEVTGPFEVGDANATAGAGSWTAVASYLPIGTHTLTATVVDGDGGEAEASVNVTVAALPSGMSLGFTPAQPSSADALHARLELGALADTGNATEVEYAWFVNDAPVDVVDPSDTLGAEQFVGGDTVRVRVTVTTTALTGWQGELETDTRIAPSRPSAPTVVLFPEHATVASEVTCLGVATDGDDDRLTVRYAWTLNDAPLAGDPHGASLRLADTHAGAWRPLVAAKTGDVLACSAVANDGTGDGPAARATVTLGPFDACATPYSGCGTSHALCAATDTAQAACRCAPGYDGDGVQCTKVDACATGLFACGQDAECVYDPPTSDTPSCRCPLGYDGDPALACRDEDECRTGAATCPAHATCQNLPGTYACVCAEGFDGDGTTCTDRDECALGLYVCAPEASCKNTDSGYTCTCPTGFYGDGQSCHDQNECAAGASTCGPGAGCVNTAGSFDCVCLDGYTGDGTTCTNIDECALGQDDCLATADCTDTPGGFTCGCKSGYVGDGADCEDVDECAAPTSACPAHAACQNLQGGFACACAAGYEDDGEGGCRDANECTSGAYVCDPAADCVNRDGSYRCACRTGWMSPTGDGKTCSDIDECAPSAAHPNGLANCHPNALCTNTPGSFACACKPGFSGDGVTSCVE